VTDHQPNSDQLPRPHQLPQLFQLCKRSANSQVTRTAAPVTYWSVTSEKLKTPEKNLYKMGEPHTVFLLSLALADPEQSAKEDKEMTLETDLKLGETQLCLSCDEVKPLTDGDCLIRYGVFVEFNCYQCQQKKTQ
jgi:hypothetical protein